MHAAKLALVVIASASLGAAATLVAQKPVLHSTVFDWTTADTKPNAWGAVRQVMRDRTPTLDELEIHISTLQPGKSPHAPHQHQHEELLILKEGTLETFQSGVTRTRRPGRDHLPRVERDAQRHQRRPDAGHLLRDQLEGSRRSEMS